MNRRNDLLALTEQDLETYSNRGTVKRALKEVEEGQLACEWTESGDGALAAAWSDGERCEFPADGTIKDGRCSCPATGICRHLVRTVLAYRAKAAAGAAAGGSGAAAAVQPAAWDPGGFSDEALVAAYGAAAVQKARGLFEEGLLIELQRGAKPVARIHGLGAAVRFLVPGDLRYCRSDCSGLMGDQAVMLGVWGFRRLPSDQASGFVVTGAGAVELPAQACADAEEAVGAVFATGLEGLPPHFLDRLANLEGRLRSAALIWPADALEDLGLEIRRYQDHDNLFDPERLLDHAGELVIRIRALRSGKAGIPQLLIAGSRHDRQEEFGKRRFTGLGAQAAVTRKTCVLRAYLEDEESGSIVVIEKEAAVKDDAAPRSFAAQAEALVFPGCRLSDAASGQILASGGKKSSGGRITPARKATVQPQNYDWDKLRGAYVVDDFAELDARLDGLPPASLRSRRPGEDFYVLKVAAAGNAGFAEAANHYRFEVADTGGNRVACVMPYDDRAEFGGEALLGHLNGGSRLRFVSGTVRRTAAGKVLNLAGAVFEREGRTVFVQPWLERRGGAAGSSEAPSGDQDGQAEEAARPAGGAPDIRERCLGSMREALVRLALSGVERADQALCEDWRRLAAAADSAGLGRLGAWCARIAGILKRAAHGESAAAGEAPEALRGLAALLKLAQD